MNCVEEKLVSIIMPAYNCEGFINQAIDSVINQTYNKWELIIVDDCSIDKTGDIIQLYELNDPRIKYYKLKKNSGAAVARNTAIEYAKGEYIAFLDSDDIWFNEKLDKQITFMIQNNYDFSCTSYTKIDEEGEDIGITIKAKEKSDYECVLKTCPGNSTVIYNAKKLGKFKIPNIKKRNDYVMWLQIMKNVNFLYGISEPLSSHRIRNGSISSKKFSLVIYHWKVYRDIEKLSIFKSIYLILYWIFVTIFKLR